jgi:SAM-dependent methyltransferase
MSIFYSKLADWWPLISPPSDYAEEAAFFLSLLVETASRPSATLLELGSGGGNNAVHMKSAFSSVTLVDLSERMLAVSRDLNPDCEHVQGDLRTVRLGHTYDVVFVHDAIDYMTTVEDLEQALQTLFIHCKSGGIALLVPDSMRETFASSTDHGGEDGEGRSVRFLEWSYDPDESDTTYTTDYVFVLREEGQPVKVEYDQHLGGLFWRDQWLALLAHVGFKAEFVIDPYARHVFVAHKP